MESRIGIRFVKQWDITPDLKPFRLDGPGLERDETGHLSSEEYSDMAKKTAEPVPPPAKPQVPEDAPIVAKMIGKRKEFEARAKATHEKTFEPLVTPSLYRLSPRAHALYQEWAQTTDAAHVGVSKKAVEGADEKGAKTLTHEHYEAGDTRLHEIFAGLAVVEDPDLPGESVIVE